MNARATAVLSRLVVLASLLTVFAPAVPAHAGTVGAVQDAENASTAYAPVWRWPTATSRAVLRPFALDNPYAAGHRGIDIAASPGDEVFAPADGIVRFVGWVVDRPVMSIDHGNGLVSSFEPIESDLRAGDAVRQGQLIGRVSLTTKHRTDGGLHVGARMGGYIDPMRLLSRQPRAILLPMGEG